jgi:hypothetical protein
VGEGRGEGRLIFIPLSSILSHRGERITILSLYLLPPGEGIFFGLFVNR